jgi:hypothetical protein
MMLLLQAAKWCAERCAKGDKLMNLAAGRP